MIAVSDTSPLNYLVLIDEIGLLPRLFSRIVIPPAVLRELRHSRTPRRVEAWAADLPSWVEVLTPRGTFEDAGLGRGEAEAIALGTDIEAAVTLIDERMASLVARQKGLTVTGTLGLLELAADAGFVDPVAAITRLLATNFRVSPAVIEAFLDRRR